MCVQAASAACPASCAVHAGAVHKRVLFQALPKEARSKATPNGAGSRSVGNGGRSVGGTVRIRTRDCVRAIERECVCARACVRYLWQRHRADCCTVTAVQ